MDITLILEEETDYKIVEELTREAFKAKHKDLIKKKNDYKNTRKIYGNI